MRGLRACLVLSMVAVVVLVSARLSLLAQERGGAEKGEGASPKEGRRGPARPAKSETKAEESLPIVSVQDALQRPFTFPFATPTSLTDVCEHLRRSLKARVVLHHAALDRQEVTAEDTVQLALDGVRLKTGLKLLLDQVNLTFHVIPEDNLLVLSDAKGSSEPIDHILSELKALHRDVHDLQDTVEDIQWMLGGEGEEGGAMMRKPTIIEELPGESKPGEQPKEPPPSESTERRRGRRGA
jgi:hypothetical protein